MAKRPKSGAVATVNKQKVVIDNLNVMGYKLMLTHKYNDLQKPFKIYQMKDSSDFKPFEQSAFDLMPQGAQFKFKNYLFGDYQGENELGVPNGEGHIVFEQKQVSSELLPNQIRKQFKGTLSKGML